MMFQFDIDPKELDGILKTLNLQIVKPTAMLNLRDFFQYPYYVPVEGKYHIFQGKDRKFGDDILTVKANEAHSHAIFRREASNLYPYSKLDPDMQAKYDRWDGISISRMKIKYEAEHKGQ